MNSRNSSSPNAASRREGVNPSLVSRMLDRISRLESSLAGTRLEINHLLDGELEELRAIRKELLASRDDKGWTSNQPVQSGPNGKIVEFPPSVAQAATGASTELAQAELTPLLEVASIEDLSDALAAVFKERRAQQ